MTMLVDRSKQKLRFRRNRLAGLGKNTSVQIVGPRARRVKIRRG